MRRPSPVVPLLLLGSLAPPASARAQDPGASDIVQPVTRDGQTLTMRLHRVPLRGPHFEVRVQGVLGTTTDTSNGPDRAFLGTVDERPGAVASGIVTSGGELRGSIVFDRGGTWFTRGATVTGVRGLDAPTLAWPTTPNLAAGLAGATMRRWDLGVDVTSGMYAKRGSSVAQTLEDVEYGVSNIRATYMRDALLMPRLARVIVRTAPASDPYTGKSGSTLGPLRTEWQANQQDAVRDEALVIDDTDSGGVAYRTDFDPNYAYARAGGEADGDFDVVARHEIGHNLNADDNQGGGAEGRSIMNGNAQARFSGTELQPMLTSRDARIGVFDDPGRWSTTGLPPYAGLDLADGVAPGAQSTVDVLADDHDANGQALTLTGVDPTTVKGGRAEIRDGKVLYTAPSGDYGLDSFGYTIADSCGQTATGIVLARAGATTGTVTAPPSVAGVVGGAPGPGGTTAPPADPGRADCTTGGGAATGGGSVGGTGGGTAGGTDRGAAGGGAVTAELVSVRTTTDARRSGGVAVWRCGQARPRRAALVVARGRRASNRVMVRPGRGRVCTATRTGARVRVRRLATYRAPSGYVALSPRPRSLAVRRSGSRLRIALGPRRGVLATDRRVAVNLTVLAPRRAGTLRVARCGRSQQRASTVRFARGRPRAALVTLGNPGSAALCVRLRGATRVHAELEARLPGR